MAYIDFLSDLHQATKRDYIKRVLEHPKAECAEIALQFGKEYWDGARQYGYGGYTYDGRWLPVAKRIVAHYALKPGAHILDVGCGKGFLLYEISRLLPDAHVAGIDISSYAIENAKPEIRPFLQVASATQLPFGEKSFDLVFSINTLHNLYNYELWSALHEIERVGRRDKYVVVESYRNEQEKVNLLYWQLTCRTFYSPREWEWVFQQAGYTGDHSHIFFE